MSARLNDGQANKYGFRWGQLDVSRMATLPDDRRVVQVSTDFGSVEIYVSKTGRSIRVFRDHIELKAGKP